MTDDELFAMPAEMITLLGDAHTATQAGERLYYGTRPGTTFPTPDLEAKIKPYIVRRDLGGNRCRSSATVASATPTCPTASATCG